MQKELSIFSFNEPFIKSKTKLLVLAGTSLFIALSEALPQKVVLLGLDLSSNPKIAGWFLLAITFYFLITVILYGSLDLIKHGLPALIRKKTRNLTGNLLGLTTEECINQDGKHCPEETDEAGTTISEFQDIKKKRVEIENSCNSGFIKISNIAKFVFEFLLPIIFSLYAMYQLCNFLSQAS